MSRSNLRILTWARGKSEGNTVVRGYLGDVKVFVIQLDEESQCREGPWLLSTSLPGLVLHQNRFQSRAEAYKYAEEETDGWLTRSRLKIPDGN